MLTYIVQHLLDIIHIFLQSPVQHLTAATEVDVAYERETVVARATAVVMLAR